MMDTSAITLNPFYNIGEDGEESKDKNLQKTKLNADCIKELEKLEFVNKVTPKRYGNGTMKLNKTEVYLRMQATDFSGVKEENILFGRSPRKDSKDRNIYLLSWVVFQI